MISRNFCIQLWLIMYYYENGFLYDYFQFIILDYEEMLRLCYSVAAGIVYFYIEIVGNYGKSVIVYRDIKLKNILVKGNGICCIGDLGLVVIYIQENNKIDLGRNNKVGIKRYMVLELLDEILNSEYFEVFKQVDVYVFGLVLCSVWFLFCCYDLGLFYCFFGCVLQLVLGFLYSRFYCFLLKCFLI